MTIKAGKTEGGDALLYGTANNPQQGSRPIGWNLLSPENVPVLVELDTSGRPIRTVTPDGQVVGGGQRAKLNSYTMTPGEILFDTDANEPPAPTGAAGSGARSDVVLWQGERTWRLTNTTDGGNIAFTIPVNVPAQPAMVGMFLPVFIENYEAMLGFQVFVSMGDENYTNAYRYEWGVGPGGNDDKKRDGWHLIHIPPSAWVVDAGAPAAQAIRSVRLRWIRQPGAKDATVFIGSPRVGIKPRTQVLIYADDVPQTFYKNALPIFDAYGLPVNLACAANWTATPTYMTTAMYQDAIERGHEVCCHSTNRIGVQLTTLGQVLADTQFNQNFVRNVLGQEFGSKHWVFANGQYWLTDRDNYNVLDLMRDQLGIVMARTTDDPIRPTTRALVGLLNDEQRRNLLTIPETLPNNTSNSQAAVLSQLDAALASGDLVTLVYHDVKLSAASPFENTAVVEAVAKRLARAVGEGEADVVRASEFYSRLTPFA